MPRTLKKTKPNLKSTGGKKGDRKKYNSQKYKDQQNEKLMLGEDKK